jgi:uncharacterized membrane protein HdeD (DUF308 family)
MKNIGLTLLGVWLIAVGLKSIIHLSFAYDTVVFGALALVSGILIVVRR